MSESRRRPRQPVTLESITARAESVGQDVTRLAKTVGIAVLALVALGSTVVYAVQEQIDSIKEKGQQFQKDIQFNTDRNKANQTELETSQQKVARLQAELAEANAQDQKQDTQINRAQGTADDASSKAEKKPPTKVIDRTVTRPASSTPTPSPTPRGLGLPPLFPTQED